MKKKHSTGLKNPKRKKGENVKVRNATPNVYNGIKFRSKLETYTYKKLKEYNIDAEYEPIKFVLIPKFSYNNENIRQLTYTPDFVGDDFIIECKGRANDAFPNKWKLFKYVLMLLLKNYKLYLLKNQKEVNEAIIKIANGHV